MAVPVGNRLLDAMERGEPTTQAETVMQCVDFPISALMSVSGLLESAIGDPEKLAGASCECYEACKAAIEETFATARES